MITITHDELPLIDRPELTSKLIKAVKDQQELLLFGPRYWGKTDVLKNVEQQFNKEGIAVYLSLLTLRCRTAQTLEREILRWLTQNEETVRNYTQKKQSRPFQAYLDEQKQQQKPILLLCDQLDYLSTNKEMQKWLKKFRRFLKDNNIMVIWSECVAMTNKSFLRNIPKNSAYEITPLTKQELINWLKNEKFNDLSTESALIDKLYQATNGVVGLIKNFTLYFVNNKFQENIVDDYIEYQSNFYSRSCHSILQGLRNYPDELSSWETNPRDRKSVV